MPFPQTPNLLNLRIVLKVFLLEQKDSKIRARICLSRYHINMEYTTDLNILMERGKTNECGTQRTAKKKGRMIVVSRAVFIECTTLC